jgi:hypothetical protein
LTFYKIFFANILRFLELRKFCFEIYNPSRDGRGNPFEIKLWFFLVKKNDQWKFFFELEKPNFMKKIETDSRK